jgi:hypothetical protein
MPVPKKIKILNTIYHQEQDLVYWDILVVSEDKKIKLAMRGREMLSGFGITNKVTTEQMKNFLSKIKGKEINWVTG